MAKKPNGVDEANFATFRDYLFEVIVGKSSPETRPTSKRQAKLQRRLRSPSEGKPSRTPLNAATQDGDPAELADFSDFIAGEIFPTWPDELKSLSYHALQESGDLAEKWSLPLSLSVFEELADMIDPSVTDSLTTYGLIVPPRSDLQSFVSPVIAGYVAAVTTPPPKWIATKVTACEICERDWVPMTYHHLIPREVHVKVLKRGWHEEHMLNSVAWLCRACHSFVHKMASNEELAREWFTVEKICAREDVQKWAQWVGRVRWKKA